MVRTMEEDGVYLFFRQISKLKTTADA